MATKEEKGINYWKNNCEENYINTLISVSKYITELEKQNKELQEQRDVALNDFNFLYKDNERLVSENNELSERNKFLEFRLAEIRKEAQELIKKYKW